MRSYWRNLRLFGCAGAAALLLAPQSFGQTVPPKPSGKAEAKEAAKETKEAVKDARDDIKEQAEDTKNSTKDARDEVKDRAKDAKDNVKDARDTTKDTATDARDNAKDRSTEVRDREPPARSRSRDRDAPESRDRDARDTRDRDDRDLPERDTRDRDSDKPDRDGTRDRDSRTDARSSSQSSFQASDVRSADIGLWFDTSARDGLVVSDVATTGTIAKLGFQEGDRIISVDGRRVTRDRDFVEHLFADDVRDQRVKVIVLREEQEQVIWVEPALLVEDYRYVDNDPAEHFGVVVDDRYDDRIVVWKVIPQSPAYYAGIRAGDVLTTFRGQELATRDDFVRVVGDLKAGEVPVQVTRNDRVRDFRVDVPEFQARTERRTAVQPNVDVERPNERREQRIEERREDRRDAVPPGVAPGSVRTPGAVRTPVPNRPRILPRR